MLTLFHKYRYGLRALLILSILIFITNLDIAQPCIQTLNSERFSFDIGAVKISFYRLIKAIVFGVAAFWLVNIMVRSGEHYIRSLHHVTGDGRSLLINLLQLGLNAIAMILVLNVLGINLSSFALFGSAFILGISFGLQKIASNFISGLILLFQRAIKVDDLVQLTSGAHGFVRHIGPLYTLIECFDKSEAMVPNEELITNRVINLTHSDKVGRIEIPVSIGYASDVESACALILEIAKRHPRCSKHHAPKCLVTNLSTHAVECLLYFWMDDIDKGKNDPKSDILLEIWRAFKEQKIDIPFGAQDIRLGP